MGISLDGLASGLDTAALIKSLMQVEAIPQTMLKNRVTATQTMVSALQSLNTRVADVAKLSATLAKPEALQKFTSVSSSNSVTVKTSAGAATGSLELTVDQLAQQQVTVTGPLTEWDSSSFTLSSAGKDYSITAVSASLDDVITAVNASEAGVKAVKFAVGDGTYRVQFTADASGAANSFSVAGTAVPFTQIRAAQDATVTLWAGSAAEQTVSSASNTFAGLMPGIDVSVSKTSSEPVTLTVQRDMAAAAKEASSLVDSLNGLLNFISANSSVTIGTGGATSGMIFTGDSMVRSITQRLTDAAIRPVDGRSPSEIGISITREGKLDFDEEKFTKALNADPARVQSAFATLAKRVETVSSELSDKYSGDISSRIKGQETTITRLNDQILNWDRRLESREASLKRIYSALEVQLSNMNAQQSYLASQLASLPSTKEK